MLPPDDLNFNNDENGSVSWFTPEFSGGIVGGIIGGLGAVYFGFSPIGSLAMVVLCGAVGWVAGCHFGDDA
jgi:hypothetical protein